MPDKKKVEIERDSAPLEKEQKIFKAVNLDEFKVAQRYEDGSAEKLDPRQKTPKGVDSTFNSEEDKNQRFATSVDQVEQKNQFLKYRTKVKIETEI